MRIRLPVWYVPNNFYKNTLRLVQFMWFMDEKLVKVTQSVNLQNDSVAVPMRKRQVAANQLHRTCSNFSKAIMVSVGVSSLG